MTLKYILSGERLHPYIAAAKFHTHCVILSTICYVKDQKAS